MFTFLQLQGDSALEPIVFIYLQMSWQHISDKNIIRLFRSMDLNLPFYHNFPSRHEINRVQNFANTYTTCIARFVESHVFMLVIIHYNVMTCNEHM